MAAHLVSPFCQSIDRMGWLLADAVLSSQSFIHAGSRLARYRSRGVISEPSALHDFIQRGGSIRLVMQLVSSASGSTALISERIYVDNFLIAA